MGQILGAALQQLLILRLRAANSLAMRKVTDPWAFRLRLSTTSVCPKIREVSLAAQIVAFHASPCIIRHLRSAAIQ